MKILLINTVFYPAINWGGPIPATFGLAKKLAEKGHEVTVYTSDALDYNTNMNIQRQVVMKEGFKIYYFRNWSTHIKYTFTPGMVLQLLKHAKEFDIIHIHSYRQFQDMMGFIILSFIGKPFVLTSHGYVLPSGRAGWYKMTYDFVIGKKLLSSANKVIAFNEKQSMDYQKMGVKKDRIRIIPNTIEIEDLPQKGSLKRSLKLKDDAKIVLYLGRVEEIKGISTLIEAFSKIRIENLHLVIAGPDFGFLDKAKELVERFKIGNRTYFTGLLNKEQKFQALVDADVVVYPSLYEAGISYVILETASAARPLVISNSTGFVKEALEHNACLVFQTNDIKQLKEKIETLLEDSEEAQSMGLRAQRVIREKFSWDVAVKDHLQIYDEVMKSG